MKLVAKMIYYLPGMIFTWFWIFITEGARAKKMKDKDENFDITAYVLEKYKHAGLLFTEVVSIIFWVVLFIWWIVRL